MQLKGGGCFCEGGVSVKPASYVSSNWQSSNCTLHVYSYCSDYSTSWQTHWPLSTASSRGGRNVWLAETFSRTVCHLRCYSNGKTTACVNSVVNTQSVARSLPYLHLQGLKSVVPPRHVAFIMPASRHMGSSRILFSTFCCISSTSPAFLSACLLQRPFWRGATPELWHFLWCFFKFIIL